MTTTLRLRGPADIISILPYHLGYRPTDSILLVCLRRSRLVLVARLDLPPPGVDLRLVVDELLPPVEREAPDSVVVVGFESTRAMAGRFAAPSDVLRDVLVRRGIPVDARLLVRDGRWWNIDCTQACCPPDGEPVLADEQVPAVAQYIALGRDPASDRASLAGRLATRPGSSEMNNPDRDTECAAVIRHLEEARRTRRMLARFRRDSLLHWATLLSDPTKHEPGRQVRPALRVASSQDVTPQAWAWLCVSLLDVDLRDLLIAWLCPGTLDLEVFPPGLVRQAREHLPDVEAGDRDSVVARLTQVARESPHELTPGPLTVLAYVAWSRGDGALARIAVERALAADPAYRLALLLERMVDLSVRPERSA